MKPLADSVAVVAGATRGAGRGIARMLGADVVRLFDLVRAESGRLDLLVNGVWGGDDLTEWGTPFWKADLGKGRRIIDAAVWGHILTARHALPLMVGRNSGLVVEITDGDFLGYHAAFFYDFAKASGIRLAYALAAELRGTGVTALALTPGFLRSEAMLARFGVTEANWNPHLRDRRSRAAERGGALSSPDALIPARLRSGHHRRSATPSRIARRKVSARPPPLREDQSPDGTTAVRA